MLLYIQIKGNKVDETNRRKQHDERCNQNKFM